MMIGFKDFSFRKFRRKAKSDRIPSAAVSAFELLIRQKFGDTIYNSFTRRNRIRTVGRSDLAQISRGIYRVEPGHQDEASDTHPPFVAELDSGVVLPQTGLSYTEDGAVIEESVADPGRANHFVMESLLQHIFFDDVPLRRLPITVKTHITSDDSERIKTAAPIAPRFPNYYHWIVETVPKIRYVRKYEEVTGRDVTFLFPANLPTWMDDTVDLLGIPEEKRERAKSSIYQVDNLIIPSFPPLIREDYDWLRTTVLEHLSVNSDASNAHHHVYISRSNAIERRVVNEDEVRDMLSTYDFRTYRPENRSVGWNAQLFKNAELVVGPHGAGLTDIVFTRDGSLLELFGAKVKPPYEELANLVGIDYGSLRCEPRATDIFVDTEELGATISGML